MYVKHRPKFFKPSARQGFSSLREEFNFIERIFIKNQKIFKSLESEAISFFADLTAALSARLLEKKYLKEELLEQGLILVRKRIQSLGYDQTNEKDWFSDTKTKNQIIIVFGCQGEEMLRKRVVAAGEFIKTIPQNISIDLIFSGDKPSRRKGIEIQNESKLMKSIFYEKFPNFDQGRHFEQHVLVKSEKKSKKTEDNVVEFFKQYKDLMNNPVDIFLVSSNFHLVRIGEIFESTLKKLEKSNNKKYPVKSIFLVGSEKLHEPEGITRNVKYAKQLFYHMYKFIFHEMQYKKIRKKKYLNKKYIK